MNDFHASGDIHSNNYFVSPLAATDGQQAFRVPRYSLLGSHGDITSVVLAAAALGASAFDIIDWYTGTPITEFDGLTPARLVSLGRTKCLLAFLESIRSGDRD